MKQETMKKESINLADLEKIKSARWYVKQAICMSKEKNYNLEKASEELTDILAKYNYS